MALKFRCSRCDAELTFKFLKKGEQGVCSFCRAEVLVPEDAKETDSDSITQFPNSQNEETPLVKIPPPENKYDKTGVILGRISMVLGINCVIFMPILSFVAAARPSNSESTLLVKFFTYAPAVLFIGAVIFGVVVLFRKKSQNGILYGKSTAITGMILSVATPVVFAMSMIMLGPERDFDLSDWERTANFNPETHQGDVGEIVLPYKGKSTLTISSNEGQIRLETDNGIFASPVGDYKLYSYEVKDGKWSALCYFWDNPLGVSLKKDEKEHLKIGVPFTASIDIEEEGSGSVSFGFNFTGCGGNNFNIFGDDILFNVVSKDGMVIWHDKFKSG